MREAVVSQEADVVRRVSSLEFREIRLPLREPFRISSGVVAERRILLVRLEDEDGTVAWAECVAGEEPNYSSETVDTAWVVLRQWLGPRLLAEPVSPRTADAVLRRDLQGHRMASAALEMGVWELAARRHDVPLARLIGGTRERVEVGISLGIQADPAALVERARAGLAAEYRRIKLKIRPGQDLEYVAAVREAVGADVALSVDANSSYHPSDTEHLAGLDSFRLVMIEQPFEAGDLVRHAALQRRLRTPICLDESITSLTRAEDMLALGSGRIVNIKPGRVGGFTESMRIHDACARAGVPVWCGGMLESGIGRGYNVALATLPNFTMPGDLSPSARYWERDIVTPEWTMEDGRVRVPDGTGTGVSVDVDRVDDLTVRREVLTAR